MTIKLDIRPEVQAELARQAAAHGSELEPYAAGLLEEAVPIPAGSGLLDQQRFENTLREIAQFSHRIPSRPDEAFTRENLYQDEMPTRAHSDS
ncbi:MAG TPA: hypothetical protein VEU96_17830 [Bryobacteraceae bacterium]|nr:hypothetical protein [Bryobacteraceae bacterium]